MTDDARKIAFDPAAPQGERNHAMTELQKAHLPGAVDVSIADAVADIQHEYMVKAVRDNVVPFPSKAAKEGGKGMQSLVLDDWQISIQGDWWERPSSLGFDSLKSMVEQTPVLNAVVMTRSRQVSRFCRIAESGNDLPGFTVRHIDREHQISKQETDGIQKLNRFFANCGWEFLPRKRKALRRDSFSVFMQKAVRDSLTLDSVGIELEWKKDKKSGIDGFYCVDGGTIRLCSEDGYNGQDEIFAVQAVQGMVRAAYTFDDLIYEPRNPRSDVRACGYGLAEPELLVRVVTGFLNAMTYNLKGFDSNAIPRGILHLTGSYQQKDLDAFKRYWNSMVQGVNNAWALPVMVSDNSESKVQFDKLGVDYDEMYFSKWMTFLTSIICAIYGMSPAEINFDSFTAGDTSALSGSDTSEKLAASKDSGLRPLLAYFENLFTDYIVQEFSPDFCFRWTGLDPADRDKKFEMRKLVLTVNEARAEEGYGKHPDETLGNAPINPSLTGVYMQTLQPDEPPDGGGDGGGDGDGGEPGGETKDMHKAFGLPPLWDVAEI